MEVNFTKGENGMKMKFVILGVLLLAIVASGCNKTETDTGGTTTNSMTTNAPVSTNH